MSNAPLAVSQWGRPPMARRHTVKTGPINLTLETVLFQEQKKRDVEEWIKFNEVVAPSLLVQWINGNKIPVLTAVFREILGVSRVLGL